MSGWNFLLLAAFCVLIAYLWLRLLEEVLRMYDLWRLNRKEPPA